MEDNLNKCLEESIEKLRSEKGYLNAGFPGYNTLFGRDSLISAWQLLNYDPRIAKDTLDILALYQAKKNNKAQDAEPGKILHEYRFDPEEQAKLPGWGWPYYGSVDATSLFVILFCEYIQKSGDIRFLKKRWSSVKNAVKWHVKNSEKNKYGFIGYDPANPDGLKNQGWKDSSEPQVNIRPYPVYIVEEQGYAYKAYNSFVKLSRLLDKEDSELTGKSKAEAQRIKNNFHKQFWVPGEKYYALALDSTGTQTRSVTSNAGHLLMCDDFLERGQIKAVAGRIFKKDIFTIGGIRTLSSKDPNFDPFSYHSGSIWPHDNWFIFMGLKNKGLNKEAVKLKKAVLRAYNELGHMPELYSVTEEKGKQQIVSISKGENKNEVATEANPLQAWAAGALWYMTST